MKGNILQAYKDLAIGIVEQAIRDYKSIKNNGYEARINSLDIQEVLDFFNSQWFGVLCDINSDDLVKKLCVFEFTKARPTMQQGCRHKKYEKLFMVKKHMV